MKKLLLLLPLAVACKTKATCDAYSVYRVPYSDSMMVSQWHEHVYFDNKRHCIYVPKEIIYFTDTIEFRIPIEQEHYKLK